MRLQPDWREAVAGCDHYFGRGGKRRITPIRRRTSGDFPRVAPAIDHQHQRREPAQQSMCGDRRRIRERQCKVAFRESTYGFGEFVAERDRKRNRTTIAAGPAIGGGTETMNAGQEIRGHSDVAVPDIIETDLPDLRPQPLQSLRDPELEPLRLVARSDHGASADEPGPRIVARAIELAMRIVHS